MIYEALSNNLAAVNVKVNTWQEAIYVGGQLLIEKGLIKKGYLDDIVSAMNELGPYAVIAPGIALAHARPSSDVLEDCIALITLQEGVNFNHKTNDPVDIVFVFGAKSNNAHLDVIQELAIIISNPNNVEAIKQANSIPELLNIFKGA
ncbi:MAG: PTS sugar transporter subunit IIA [Bacilli bacterium]